MSVDLLHEKVRKLKNPSMIDLALKPELLPAHLLEEEGNAVAAYGRFCRELMDGLKGIVPALRLPFGDITLLGPEGLALLSDLLKEAKEMGFLIVNVVTNGTFPIDLPEADLILLSLDGDKARHNEIRGDTYDKIMENVRNATADNICFYMAINQINKDTVRDVCIAARDTKNVRAVSFNFHTPYPDTRSLALTKEEKAACCEVIKQMMKEGAPVFNLKSAFPYLIENKFPTPCHQCVVIEDGKVSVCGRCIDVPGLCDECGYFFVAEYTLLFRGNLKIIFEMLKTYLKYV